MEATSTSATRFTVHPKRRRVANIAFASILTLNVAAVIVIVTCAATASMPRNVSLLVVVALFALIMFLPRYWHAFFAPREVTITERKLEIITRGGTPVALNWHEIARVLEEETIDKERMIRIIRNDGRAWLSLTEAMDGFAALSGEIGRRACGDLLPEAVRRKQRGNRRAARIHFIFGGFGFALAPVFIGFAIYHTASKRLLEEKGVPTAAIITDVSPEKEDAVFPWVEFRVDGTPPDGMVKRVDVEAATR